MNTTRLNPTDFARKYGADRISRLLPLFESYGYVTMTESGNAMLSEAKRLACEPFGLELDPCDRPAAERLREWRKRRARAENVSAYIVMTNKKLFALASAHPATATELSSLGVSDRLIESCASEILEACRRDGNAPTFSIATSALSSAPASAVAPRASSLASETTSLAVASSVASPRRRCLGRGRAAAIIANVIVPWAMAEGRLDEAPEWLPPEDISDPVRLTAFRLFGRDHNPAAFYATNGLLIQGLLQIHRDYCLQVHPDCADCNLLRDLVK